jgi:acyl carrier protein
VRVSAPHRQQLERAQRYVSNRAMKEHVSTPNRQLPTPKRRGFQTLGSWELAVDVGFFQQPAKRSELEMGPDMNRAQIERIVMNALDIANQSRVPEQRLDVSATARLFGGSSPLDSLGLVALLIDIEDAFQAEGVDIVLSDERALAQTRSPFRNVPSLVAYIEGLTSKAQV